jgi:excisionase family DNA binding protein
MSETTTQIPTATTPLLVTKHEARCYLGGISMRTLEKLIANKELPVRRIGRRALIPFKSLVAFTRSDHTFSRRKKRTQDDQAK